MRRISGGLLTLSSIGAAIHRWLLAGRERLRSVRYIIGFVSAGLLFGFLNLAGTELSSVGTSFGWIVTFEHGWPWAFLVRYTDGSGSRFRVWQSPDYELSVDVLLANVGVVVVLGACLGEILFRLRRFTVFGLLVAITLVAANLGYVRHLFKTTQDEDRADNLLADFDIVSDYSYLGPVWLARLSGSHRPLGMELRCISSVKIRNETVLQNDVVIETLCGLRFLEFIESPYDTVWLRHEFAERYCQSERDRVSE